MECIIYQLGVYVLKLCCAMIRKGVFLTRAIRGLVLPGYGTTLLSNWCIIFSDRTLVCHLQRSHIPLRSASWNMDEEFINWNSTLEDKTTAFPPNGKHELPRDAAPSTA